MVKKVSKMTGLSRRKTEDVFDAIYQVLCDALAKNEEIYFKGFGKFFVSVSPEREVFNSFCNKSILISSKFVPKFKAFKKFREKIK